MIRKHRVEIASVSRLGEVLRRLLAIDDDELARALERARERPALRLGEVLVSLGACGAGDVAEGLRLQGMLRNGRFCAAMGELAKRAGDRLEDAVRRSGGAA